MAKAEFVIHDTELPLPYPVDLLVKWLDHLTQNAQRPIESLLYVFCSDEYVYQLNVEHLKHDFYTDILTFPYSYDPIAAEIYISLERVVDNAEQRGDDYGKEFLRVIAHGLLHMMGYDDQTEEEKQKMREQEDECIILFKTKFQSS